MSAAARIGARRIAGARPPSGPEAVSAGRFLPHAFCILAMILVGTDAMPIVLGPESPVTGLVRGLMYLAIAAVCFAWSRAVAAAFVDAPWLVALMMLVCASPLWSVDPDETLRRLPSVLAPTLLGMLVGGALSLRGLLMFLASLAVVVAAANLAAVAFVPQARGAPPWDDVWRGVFNHKNGLGGACAILLPFVVFATFCARGAWQRGIFLAGTIATIVILAASASRTSQIVGICALLNLAVAHVMRRRLLTWATLTFAVFLGVAVLAALLFAADLADNVFRAMGRKPTMSGRLPIWEYLWPWIESRPWLGFGYSAFWDPESRRVAGMAYEFSLRYVPWYSHNGAIETLLNVGVIGLVLLVMVVAAAFRSVFVILLRQPAAFDVVLLQISLFSFLIHNIAESTMLARDDLLWIVFVAIVVRLGALARAAAGAAELPGPAVALRPRHGVRARA